MKRWTGSLLLAYLCATSLGAQTLRDPTLAPAAARATGDATATAAAKANPLPIDSGNVAVLVRDGTPYLVLGTRLFATGQQVGTARIERITESEIWLREAGKLNKIKVYQGVERRPAVPLNKP